jgi:hypothetical protein
MTKKGRTALSANLLLKIFLALVVLAALIKLAAGGLADGRSRNTLDATADDRVAFAKCLLERGMIMYGVDTCEYCQMQKKMFGQAFDQIRYVNCDFEKPLCQEKGITRYPAWEYQGRISSGMQSFEKLSQTSGCILPK